MTDRTMRWHVYQITNITGGKNYIGITGGPIEKRWREHVSAARRGARYALSRAIIKYGPDDFTVIELSSAPSLIEACAAERSAIARLGTLAPNGYNLTSGGEGTEGVTASLETREKLSASHKGIKPSPETLAKLSLIRKGQRRSDETRARIRTSLQRPEIRAKLSAALKGQIRSPQTRAKISAARSGIRFSDEHRAALCRAWTSRPAPQRLSHCKRGHDLSADTRTGANGVRHCRECQRIRQATYMQR